MITCKQVSNSLSNGDYKKLPPLKRALMLFHVAICPVCGAYNKLVMKFYDAARGLRAREEAQAEDPNGPSLSNEARERMKEKMRNPDE